MICPMCNGNKTTKQYHGHGEYDYTVVECTVCRGTGSRPPRVLNKYKAGIPKWAVYVGRGSPWGNPFKIGEDGDRDTVIAKYEEMLLASPEKIEAVKIHLKDKDLVCFCAPSKCHADILLRIANEV